MDKRRDKMSGTNRRDKMSTCRLVFLKSPTSVRLNQEGEMSGFQVYEVDYVITVFSG